jgi:predicted kinase
MLAVTIGCPGSGKSTWADTNLPLTTCRLERDRFRECIFGSRRAYHEHLFERSFLSRVVTQSMGAAMSNWPVEEWAITDTGLDWPAVAPFVEYATGVGAEVVLVVFDRPWELLAERNTTRDEEHRIPHDILVERFERFNDPEAWWRHAPYRRLFA